MLHLMTQASSAMREETTDCAGPSKPNIMRMHYGPDVWLRYMDSYPRSRRAWPAPWWTP